MDAEYINRLENAYSLISQANSEMIHLWVANTFLTWRWWLALLLTIGPWIAWYFLRKKDSTDRLLYAGLVVALISSWMDVIGILFGLWSYHADVVPFSPSFIPWDITLLPVSITLLIQYKPHVSPILKSVIYSGITSFVMEPALKWLGFYWPKHWEYYYSFPIYILIYLIAHYISSRSAFTKIG